MGNCPALHLPKRGSGLRVSTQLEAVLPQRSSTSSPWGELELELDGLNVTRQFPTCINSQESSGKWSKG